MMHQRETSRTVAESGCATGKMPVAPNTPSGPLLSSPSAVAFSVDASEQASEALRKKKRTAELLGADMRTHLQARLYLNELAEPGKPALKEPYPQHVVTLMNAWWDEKIAVLDKAKKNKDALDARHAKALPAGRTASNDHKQTNRMWSADEVEAAAVPFACVIPGFESEKETPSYQYLSLLTTDQATPPGRADRSNHKQAYRVWSADEVEAAAFPVESGTPGSESEKETQSDQSRPRLTIDQIHKLALQPEEDINNLRAPPCRKHQLASHAEAGPWAKKAKTVAAAAFEAGIGQLAVPVGKKKHAVRMKAKADKKEAVENYTKVCQDRDSAIKEAAREREKCELAVLRAEKAEENLKSKDTSREKELKYGIRCLMALADAVGIDNDLISILGNAKPNSTLAGFDPKWKPGGKVEFPRLVRNDEDQIVIDTSGVDVAWEEEDTVL